MYVFRLLRCQIDVKENVGPAAQNTKVCMCGNNMMCPSCINQYQKYTCADNDKLKETIEHKCFSVGEWVNGQPN